MIFAFVLIVLLGISVLMNLGHMVESMFTIKGVRTHTVGPRLDEVVLEDNDASSKIAVVPIEGIITSQIIDRGGFSLVDIIKAQLKRADKDDRVKEVILKVDSPGGEVLAGPLIGEAGVVRAELDLARIAAGRRMFDPTGHYSRPDVLSLRRSGP